MLLLRQPEHSLGAVNAENGGFCGRFLDCREQRTRACADVDDLVCRGQREVTERAVGDRENDRAS